jgi:hypothetical protein
LEAADGGGDGEGAEVAFEAVAEGDGAGFGVAGADDECVGVTSGRPPEGFVPNLPQ